MYILKMSKLFVNFQNRFISIFYIHNGSSNQEKTFERILRGKEGHRRFIILAQFYQRKFDDNF